MSLASTKMHTSLLLNSSQASTTAGFVEIPFSLGLYSEHSLQQFDENTLAFGDTNGWQAGDIAVHPQGTRLTSIDALDAILDEFKNKDLYPSITNVTFVGHG